MKKIILTLLTLLTLSLIPSIVFAQGVELNPELRPEYAATIPGAADTGRATAANVILQLIAGSLIYIAGPLAVLMIVVGGVRFIISRGDQTQMEEAKKNITWAIIGLLVIAVSYIIVTNVITLIAEQGTVGSDETKTSQLSNPTGAETGEITSTTSP